VAGMMRTIYKDPERYANYWSLIPGFYAAGDVATKDEDGYFRVMGRADDVMNVSAIASARRKWKALW
jgi:acetyl-CoA synthetase